MSERINHNKGHDIQLNGFLCFHCLNWLQWIFIFIPLQIEGGIMIWFYIFTRLVLPWHNIFVFWYHSSKSTKQNVGEKRGPKSFICFSRYSCKYWKHYLLLLMVQLKWVCPTYTFVICFFNNWKSSTTAFIPMDQLCCLWVL